MGAKRLGFMHQIGGGLTPEHLRELGEVQLELTDLTRSIRPMKQILRHFIDEGNKEVDEDKRIGRAALMYLEDVVDTLEEMLEDIAQLMQMAKSIEDADERRRDKRMNNTLFVLSLISAIFLPAQFITGLYGMNFVDMSTPDRDPNIPELTWEHGYEYFWGLQVVGAVVM